MARFLHALRLVEMTTLSQKQITTFQDKILDWYAKNKRDLPWRRTRDPYAILISEVMLQQTQVSRVIAKYEEWMRAFPTLQTLAATSTRDVLLHWSGLGYNRRALYLKRLAEVVVKNNKGVFSQSEKELKKLPGIGQYTARAILCFAFDKQIAVVDTNVRKVILVHFKDVFAKYNKERDPSTARRFAQDDKLIQAIADLLLPQGGAYEWNQALMDYSSAMLKKEKIALHQQKPFKQSNRFYRGQIVKLLLKKNETLESLFQLIENAGITKNAFVEILKAMEKDALIVKKGGYYTIAQ